jgi:cell division protein FtsL
LASYQYETSPRKYKTTYDDKPIKKQLKKPNNKKQKTLKKKKIMQKEIKMAQRKMMLYLATCFLLLFGLIVLRAQVNQNFNQIQRLKAQVVELQKENDQLQVSVQNDLNISSIEQNARDNLGMQKLTSSQIRYVSLNKKDYVAPSVATVKIEEENIFTSIFNFIKNLF